MNDWEQIQRALFSNPEMKAARAAEVWRWTAAARDWADAEGLDISRASRGDMCRYLDTVEPTCGPRNPNQRKWAFGKLVEASQAVRPRRARRSSLAARLEDVPPRSPLGKALDRVLARAGNDANRRMWPTCLGAFLAWCDGRGLDATECWPGDLARYRRDRLESGYRSPGEYLRVARMLLKELSIG